MNLSRITFTVALLAVGVDFTLCIQKAYAQVTQGSFDLRDIPGTELSCGSQMPNIFLGGHCKFVLEGEVLTVFIKKNSQEIKIPLKDIFSVTLLTSSIGGQVQGYIGYLTSSDQSSGNRANFLNFEKVVTERKFNPLNVNALSETGRTVLQQHREDAKPRFEMLGRLQAVLPEKNPKDVSATVSELVASRSCVRCDLRGANLANLDLRRVNLEGANLKGANLKGSNLEDANFIGASLDDADLSQSNLKVAFFSLASMRRTRLTGAELNGARFHWADLSEANLDQTSFRSAKFLPADLTGANLTNASLAKSSLRSVSMILTNLQNANLQQAEISDRSILSGSNLQGANLSSTTWNAAMVTYTSFQNANLQRASFKKLLLWNQIFKMQIYWMLLLKMII
ncbi:MAG: pentapeptide repeat-containing protein [Calothrix sp. CSU_2_0]|nr:pentapeptide repeat-containing protein [Calothrix sp. CSU_2_0]